MTVFTLPRGLSSATLLPVRSAQVREDAAITVRLADRQRAQLGAPIRALVAASGGCGAAALAASGCLDTLHLVDPNPAHLALTRLKLHLLAVADPDARARILGHRELAPTLRAAALTATFTALRLPADILGPPALVAHLGPDQVGRYEQRFAAVRRLLPAPELAALLALTDPAEQARHVAAGTVLGDALDAAFERVVGPPVGRVLAARSRQVLGAGPAATNPYVWQAYGRGGPLVPWLAAGPARLCALGWIPSTIEETLRAARPGRYDLIDLSDLLERLEPASAARTLRLAHAALRRGGVLVTRRAAPSAELPGFDPDPDASAGDRSLLPGALQVGIAR